MADQAGSPNRPGRLLAIDGGGLAGLIPAEALIQIEEQLDQITGTPKLLCDRFDLIGGTSTGAILAAGLALGLKASDLRDFYLKFGNDIFTKSFLPLRLWHKYPSGPLEEHLKEVFKEATLGGSELRTKVLIVTKNATLGNDWFFTNNPNNKFFKINSGLPLWQVVRASTAAPTYFPPQTIKVPDSSGKKHSYEFIDGGVSSYNNPALRVFLDATAPATEGGLGWPMGANELLLISLGTGYSSVTVEPGKASGYTLLGWAQYMIKELMNEANLQQNVLMHIIGQRPAAVGSATAELVSTGAAAFLPGEKALDRMSSGTQKLVTYQRVTVGLTRQRLDQLGLHDVDPLKVREMDAADQIPNMQRLGAAVAKEQVKMEALKSFF